MCKYQSFDRKIKSFHYGIIYGESNVVLMLYILIVEINQNYELKYPECRQIS